MFYEVWLNALCYITRSILYGIQAEHQTHTSEPRLKYHTLKWTGSAELTIVNITKSIPYC